MRTEAEVIEFVGKNPNCLMRDIKANAPTLTEINLSNMVRNLLRSGKLRVERRDNGEGRQWPYYTKA
jgi:hypothetical protein